MAITWTLRQWLALNHNIYRATDLQRVLAERAEYHLTVQAVSTLMKGPPSELRLRTIQALCKSLNCQLSDFCEVSPDDETTLPMAETPVVKAPSRRPKRVSKQRKSEIQFPIPPQTFG